MRRLKLFRTSVHSPYLNISTEDHLFRNVAADEEALFLWRNDPCVIIGRNQNPWKECRQKEMEARGVSLVRRHSGGGAVYQDLGNTCFSFVSPKSRYSKERNSELLLAALSDFGIDAELRGRNDIVFGDTKISGHAYKLNNVNALHHGTLLREVDMTTLTAVLSPSKAKLQSKGVSSVSARVTNLTSRFPALTHEAFCAALTLRWQEAHAAVPMATESLAQASLPASVLREAKRLSSWEWRFGESPKFSLNITHRFPWGICDLYLDYEKGRVLRSKLYSDALSPELVAALQDGVDAQLDANVARERYSGPEIEDFFNWVNAELND